MTETEIINKLIEELTLLTQQNIDVWRRDERGYTTHYKVQITVTDNHIQLYDHDTNYSEKFYYQGTRVCYPEAKAIYTQLIDHSRKLVNQQQQENKAELMRKLEK